MSQKAKKWHCRHYWVKYINDFHQSPGTINAPFLKFATISNVGTVHKGTPFLIFLFLPSLHAFSGKFFYKSRVYDPDLA
jgi:hypothetical protein